MTSCEFVIPTRSLRQYTFDKLRNLVVKILSENQKRKVVLTEKDISNQELSKQRFVVAISDRFSILILGEILPESPGMYKLGITFDLQAIYFFLNSIEVDSRLVRRAQKMLKPNDAVIQSEFTLSLLEILETESGVSFSPPETIYPAVSVCQPVEEALHHHVEKERLLNQVTAQTHQRLELPAILASSVEQVRQFIQVDRLVIYQLNGYSHDSQTDGANLSPQVRDCITYEARASDQIPSLLHHPKISELGLVSQYQSLYLQGFILAVENRETARLFSEQLLESLQIAQAQSQLVAPIIVQNKLWGLLIAHQCFEARLWKQSDKDFLQHISEHLGVAIFQAQLYAQVQQQKHTLEQQVTERTQALRDALVAAQAANRFKTEFLATMSHELRTPLTCVIGMSSTLLRWSFGNLTQKQQHYIQTIYNSGEHLLELINDILEFSELESGKTLLNVSEFSLTRLARQCFRSIADKAAVDGVKLNLDLSINEECDLFRADPGRVHHILFNLLSNAVKFTSTGGQVTLHVSVEDGEAIFEVEDTGIGIPENQQPLLFQTFQQLDSSYTRQYGGAGLGLALTKQLVDLHGGRIDVESRVGVGSKFTVCLPLQPMPKAQDRPKPVQTNHQKPASVNTYPKGHIVLVTDREEDATLICNLLTAAGYQVVWMIEGSTALDKIQLLQPIVAIVDREVAGMDGHHLVATLRALPATQSLKILLLDDLSTEEAQQGYRASGANDCVAKPMQPEQLLSKLIALLSSSTPNPEA